MWQHINSPFAPQPNFRAAKSRPGFCFYCNDPGPKVFLFQNVPVSLFCLLLGAACSGGLAAFISSHAVNLHMPTRVFNSSNRGARMRSESLEPEQMDARRGGNEGSTLDINASAGQCVIKEGRKLRGRTKTERQSPRPTKEHGGFMASVSSWMPPPPSVSARSSHRPTQALFGRASISLLIKLVTATSCLNPWKRWQNKDLSVCLPWISLSSTRGGEVNAPLLAPLPNWRCSRSGAEGVRMHSASFGQVTAGGAAFHSDELAFLFSHCVGVSVVEPALRNGQNSSCCSRALFRRLSSSPSNRV